MSQDEAPRPLPGPEKKPGLLQRSREMIDSVAQGIKGKDMNSLVEEFTSEMTLVAEGLSADLSRAQEELSQLTADQTIQSERAAAFDQKLGQLQRRVEALERKQDRQAARRGGRIRLLSQLIILAAIVCGAWVVTALLQTFGGGK